MTVKKVLVLRPDLNDPGGVAGYYNQVSKYFRSSKVDIQFYCTGKTNGNARLYGRAFKTLQDIKSLRKRFKESDLVILNPSLDLKAVVRDGLLHMIAKRFYNKNTLVFFHGWTPRFEDVVDKYAKSLFTFVFNFDKACVLSKQIRAKLLAWGFDEKSIVLETTVFEGHTFSTPRNPKKVVFLSRFVENKGCLHAIKAVECLVNDIPDIHLFMAGDGALMNDLQGYVNDRNLNDSITFTGYLSGAEKYRLLSECGIMLYPTFYGEGMPISLLEGMGMGLVPITRPSGGIPDIIVEGRNGFVVDSADPHDFAALIRYLIKHREQWKTMSENNSHEAWEKFEIKNVVKRLERLYLECAQAI